MKCTICGTEFEGNFCTNCGASGTEADDYNNYKSGKKGGEKEQKKPFYKKPVFLIIAALVLIAVVGNISSRIKENKTEKTVWSEIELGEEDTTATTTTTTTTTTATTTNTTTTAKKTEKADSKGLRADFKQAMDSYEKFMNEYVEFMKKYEKSGGTDLSLLTDYAAYMSKYSAMCDDFEKWDEEDMNDAELAYYIDVQARVQKKLLEAY